MSRLHIGLTLLELGSGFLSDRAAKRQALRDKYDKLIQQKDAT